MKSVVTTRVALIILLLAIGSFSSISGFYPPNPEPRHPVDAIQKIIEGMIGIEASESWVELINRIGTANLPPSATIFFPTGKDESLGSKQWVMDPQVIRYHIVPRAISYWQLSKHAASDHLIPTLLPYKSISVTGDTICKVISVDNVPITHPEMFHDGSIAIHGVSTLLTNHSRNGSRTKPSPPQAQPHNEDDDGFQPWTSPQAFPFEMSTGTIPPPPSNALSAPAPQPSASGGSSIKQVSIALLVGVWAVLLS